MGRIFWEYAGKGKLVPDEVTIKLWKQYIMGMEMINQFHPQNEILVLDGIPRNTKQAQLLDALAPLVDKIAYGIARGLVAAVKELEQQLRTTTVESPFAEIERQNQELFKTLQELRARQEELSLLNRELEDTNRGVVALYAELDERADYLRRASELKTKFLSNVSHEFRTPLNSIISLARLLMTAKP